MPISQAFNISFIDIKYIENKSPSKYYWECPSSFDIIKLNIKIIHFTKFF